MLHNNRFTIDIKELFCYKLDILQVAVSQDVHRTDFKCMQYEQITLSFWSHF